ncbi:MAG: PTS sugar transporter subunit IIA [Mariprofundaceae bacterium]
MGSPPGIIAMIGLVLVAHGDIGGEMLHAVEHVAGAQALCASLSVEIDSDIDHVNERLHKLVASCDSGNGVLIFADMFGGTPCNMALACMSGSEGSRVEVLSGFNLPMLIKAATLRQTVTDLKELAERSREAGRYHMHMASELLADEDRS